MRCVVASAVCFANVSAMAAPIAAEPLDVVSPDAVVAAVAFVAALKLAAPLGESVNPVSASAVLATLSIAIATAAATDTPPPDAPVFASVVVALVFDALSERPCPPKIVAPVPISAITFVVTRFRATDAPTPTLDPPPPPAVPGSAFAVEVDSDCAVRVTSPAPAFRNEPAASVAPVVMLPMTRANEPATPTDPPPPAPLVACAERSWLEVMSAVATKPAAVTMPLLRASLVMSASVIATPAPMLAEPLAAAWPSAVDAASATSRACSVSVPPLVTMMPVGIHARLDAVEMVSAIAAATLMPPPEVEACGVLVAPEPSAPAAAAAESPWLRSLAT